MVVTHEVEVRHVQYDSRKIGRGDMFVAIRGGQVDGHTYISGAIHNGAKVVVMEDDQAMPDSYFMHAGVVKIVVQNSRVALAQIAAQYYGHPAGKLSMIGVTGTNGKTTTTHLIKAIVEESGSKTGLIGTIAYQIGNETFPATHTTPESLELNGLLSRMVGSGCSSAVMEVSSHSLDQRRVHGFNFNVGVFTNLTQDHLDYHGTMEKYFEAKTILFRTLPGSSFAVINCDDDWGKRLMSITSGKTISYGEANIADVSARQVSLSMKGTRFTIHHRGEQIEINTSLVGRFNVSNILAAYGAGIALEIPSSVIRRAIENTTSVRGRFEPVISPDGWTAVVDYAHTPDALEKTLHAIHDVLSVDRQGRIITVFGCGGNRDRTKRPIMANVATTLSDVTIVTSDNPRNEDPDFIISEVMAGVVSGKTVHQEADRRKAIVQALTMAKPNDVVLIAGKGHEDYQVIGNEKIHFSDKEIVEEYLGISA